ncbi:hypothetical protein AB0M29_34970 [Streptomyces sp. NPDC051976]|uniref:hypothetical protein n=1 Tax=Streptomyces sp. NPDC051976 TaxID=3154947 RepID=UPI003427C528
MEDLQAVWDSALLADGPAGRHWTHRSVAEFLTAQACQPLPLPSVRALLTDPQNPGRVLPQLAGVAAALATLHPDVGDWLIAADPQVAMQADLQALPESQRARLAAAVLARLGSAPMTSARSGYAGLAHCGLSGQLAPLLAQGQPVSCRQEALLIIEATGLRDLDGPLMALIEELTHDQDPEIFDDDTRLAQWAAR